MVEYSRVLFEFAKTLLGESVDVSLFTISKIRRVSACIYSRYTLVCSQLVTDMSLTSYVHFRPWFIRQPWADWCIEDKYDFFFAVPEDSG